MAALRVTTLLKRRCLAVLQEMQGSLPLAALLTCTDGSAKSDHCELHLSHILQ